jgi:hypothetical protein
MTYDLFKVEINGTPPTSRTYHAATLVDKFMVVVAGEGVDCMNDIHLLNLENMTWYQPKIKFQNGLKMVPRKFHAIASIDPYFYSDENDPCTDPEFASPKKYKLMIFGGCHGDYDLLSDLYEVDLTDIINSDEYNPREGFQEMSIDEDTNIRRDVSMEKEDERGMSNAYCIF